MLEELKKQVYEANMLLPAYHLVTFTWGNASGIDRESGFVVIKQKLCPIIGRISMDYTTVRIDDFEPGEIQAGESSQADGTEDPGAGARSVEPG